MENHLADQIKEKLERGERLTVLGVFNELGTFELRHYIPQLKKVMPLTSVWKVNPTTKKRFKEYFKDLAA